MSRVVDQIRVSFAVQPTDGHKYVGRGSSAWSSTAQYSGSYAGSYGEPSPRTKSSPQAGVYTHTKPLTPARPSASTKVQARHSSRADPSPTHHTQHTPRTQHKHQPQHTHNSPHTHQGDHSPQASRPPAEIYTHPTLSRHPRARYRAPSDVPLPSQQHLHPRKTRHAPSPQVPPPHIYVPPPFVPETRTYAQPQRTYVSSPYVPPPPVQQLRSYVPSPYVPPLPLRQAFHPKVETYASAQPSPYPEARYNAPQLIPAPAHRSSRSYSQNLRYVLPPHAPPPFSPPPRKKSSSKWRDRVRKAAFCLPQWRNGAAEQAAWHHALPWTQQHSRPRSEPEPKPLYFQSKGKPYYEFTTSSPHPIVFDGKIYPTAEHLYNAYKFLQTSPGTAEHIRRLPKPADARKEAYRLKQYARRDWKNVQVGVMDFVLQLKFLQHPELRRLLMGTGKRKLMQYSPDDLIWGAENDKLGRNELGKALMRLRSSL